MTEMKCLRLSFIFYTKYKFGADCFWRHLSVNSCERLFANDVCNLWGNKISSIVERDGSKVNKEAYYTQRKLGFPKFNAQGPCANLGSAMISTGKLRSTTLHFFIIFQYPHFKIFWR